MRRPTAPRSSAPATPCPAVPVIKYRIKTGSTWGGWQTYAAGITITDEATHDVEFYATDNAGNDSAHVTKYYNLDKTAPSISLTRPVDGSTYIQGSGTTCTWTSTDALSGTSTDIATLDGSAIAKNSRLDTLASGAHTFVVTAVDAAGNQSSVTAQYTLIGLTVTYPAGGETFAQNTTMPIRWNVNPTYDTGQFGVWVVNSSGTLLLGKTVNVTAGAQNYSTSVALGSTAVGSGYNVRVSYRVSSGQPWVATAYTASTFSIASDTTPPTLTFGAHDPFYKSDSVTFTWSATDDLSAQSDLRYRYKLIPPGQTEAGVGYGSETTTTSATYGSAGSPLAEGTYTFYCKVRDAVSNWTTDSFTFVIDRSAPTVSESTGYLSTSSSAWKNTDLGGAVLAAGDSLSGIASIKYRIETGSTWGALDQLHRSDHSERRRNA